MSKFKSLSVASIGLLLAAVNPANALTIANDFSQLGMVYQNSAGVLSNTFVTGDTNVTTAFEADANYASSILGKAIGVPFTDTVSYTLANLASEQAVGDSAVTSTYANGLPATSDIRIDTNLPSFVDPTPASNADFTIHTASTSLGGANVNVSRIGDAIAGTAAALAGAYDLVTLFTHELEHSVAYSAGNPLFIAAVGPNGTTERTLVIPSSLTGLPSDYVLPVKPSGSHIDGDVQNGLFNDIVVADPGFTPNQRALLTEAEIDGACAIDGCTAAQLNTDPYATVSSVPLPAPVMLMLTGIVALCGFKFKRRSSFFKS